MPLHLIHGPPNSGKTEMVRRAFAESLSRSPVLVAPSADDVFGWERRLAEGSSGAVVGGEVVTFAQMCEEVLVLAGEAPPRRATELTRRRLARAAIEAELPGLASRVGFQPGLIGAVLDLIDDFESNLKDPGTLEASLGDDGRGSFAAGLVAVYRAYLGRLREAGLGDIGSIAMDACRVEPSGWRGRPIFLVGFDDLDAVRIELISRLRETAEVTVVLTHEADNPALVRMAGTYGQIEALEPERSTEVPAAPSPEHGRALIELERSFMREGAGTVRPEGMIRVMRSAGRRGEAEAIAAEIAALMDSGTPAEEIAIAVSGPATGLLGFADVLAGLGVPATVEAGLAARDSATGSAMLSLLRAAGPGGEPADLIAFLRGPTGVDPAEVDPIERTMLRSSEPNLERVVRAVGEAGNDLLENWDRFGWAAGDAIDAPALAGVARRLGEVSLGDRLDHHPSSPEVVEARMAEAIATACEELGGQREDRRAGAEELIATISSDAVRVWLSPVAGAVRIASPYSLRSKRFAHLFMASLQESGLAPETDSPLLTDEQRGALGLRERVDPELQERYLFYSCLTVPTRGLWLSCRTADDTGEAEAPSPLLEQVERLIGADPAEAGGRRLGQFTFAPDRAPSTGELARSLAALPPARAGETLDSLELEGDTASRIRSRLESARSAVSRSQRLGPMTLEPVLEVLGSRRDFSATGIESFLGCPSRWFIEREVDPQPLGPPPDPLAMGSLIHGALHRLYSAHPGERPTSETLPAWLGEIAALVEEVAAGSSIGGRGAALAAKRSRAAALIEGMCRAEAGLDRLGAVPGHLEAGFGLERSEEDAVEMGGWRLRGKIDRIDVGPTGAVLIDYKSGGRGVVGRAKLMEDGKVQIQLYMRAARELWDIDPIGALYVPVTRKGGKPRGLLSEDFKQDLIDGFDCVKTDFGELEQEIGSAVEAAGRAVEGMRRGRIGHDPRACRNHFDSPMVPDRPGAQDDGDRPGEEW